MIVGFTGTRDGLSHLQRFRLRRLLLDELQIVEAHHGNCIGADSVFAEFVYPQVHTVAHPCNLTGFQLTRTTAHEYRGALPPLERNRVIVDACDLLIACPLKMVEERRSGTWAAVRYAREKAKPIRIIYPDGTMVIETPGEEPVRLED